MSQNFLLDRDCSCSCSLGSNYGYFPLLINAYHENDVGFPQGISVTFSHLLGYDSFDSKLLDHDCKGYQCQ